MAETIRWGLPLLQAAQAQKHVTVNDALSRIEGFSGASAASRSLATPPPTPEEGRLYIPAEGAGGGWEGRDGALALFDNGRWLFAKPETGRRVFIEDEGRDVVHDGARWIDALGAWVHGAGAGLAVATIDHSIASGAESLTAAVIPDKALVLGVTARVLSPIHGDGVASWRLGAEGASGRYGSGYGVAAGSFAVGVTGTPVAYYGPTRLLLEAEGGPFAGGVVRLCVHHFALTPPRAD